MADDEMPQKPQKPQRRRGPYYVIELGVLIAVAVLYFVMTCGGVAI